jgi:hypothetical protein
MGATSVLSPSPTWTLSSLSEPYDKTTYRCLMNMSPRTVKPETPPCRQLHSSVPFTCTPETHMPGCTVETFQAISEMGTPKRRELTVKKMLGVEG